MPVVDPLERRVDLDEEVLGVLLEPFVELAQIRLGRAVGDVVAGADREVAGLLEQRPVVMHACARAEPVALALEDARNRSRSSARSALSAAAASRVPPCERHASSATTLSREEARDSSRSRRSRRVHPPELEDGVVRLPPSGGALTLTSRRRRGADDPRHCPGTTRAAARARAPRPRISGLAGDLADPASVFS